MKIYEIKNFVRGSDCDKIVDWLIKGQRFEQFNAGHETFNSRTVPYNKIKDGEIKQLVNAFRFNATDKVRKNFKEKLYPDYTDLVYWPNGSSMEVHADSVWLDGSPAIFPHRYATAVTYLNDDYSGGETYFPNFNFHVKPEKGKTVLFLADLEHKHGVTTTKGDRYTMPIWFTKQSKKIETE